MACTPFTVQADLFIDSDQGIWSTAPSTALGGRTVTLSGGTLTVTAPNGSENFFAGGSQKLRYKFFGTGNFLAVLKSDIGPGPITHWLSIVDFTAASMTSKLVLNVGSQSNLSLPFIQYSKGSGAACLVGAATPSGVAGLGIYRSDNGKIICPGPPPFNPTLEISGEATATAVQIKHGGTIIAGPTPFPSGSLKVTPGSASFTDVVIGGCPKPPSTKSFTLKNDGDHCLIVSAIANASPYSVTATSKTLPADLEPGDSMTVTVTFAPAAVGTFNNVDLAITRTPAKGDDKLRCSGKSKAAVPSVGASPLGLDFGHVQVNTVSGTKTTTITNTGDVPLTVTVAGPNPGSKFQWAGFNGTLTCGATHPIQVKFAPTAEGVVNDQITIVTAQAGNKVVSLTGEGCIPNAVIVPDPAPFPGHGDVRQGYRLVRYMTVRNTGDAVLQFDARLSGPDAALFGLLKPSMSITDVVSLRSYSVAPVQSCEGGAVGDGAEEVAIAFFANATPGTTASATLTLENHNDATAPASFTFALTAKIIAGNVVDVAAVFDRSGSMADPIPGGGTKTGAAVQAGRLLIELIPPDLTNRVGGTRFSVAADNFIPMTEITGANQAGLVSQVSAAALAPQTATAIAAGVMVGLEQFKVPRAGPTPSSFNKAMIVLTDGMDNTAYKNPGDGKHYTVTGILAHDPANLAVKIPTNPVVTPSDVKIYSIGLGTGQDIDKGQLDALSSATGAYYGVVDPTQPAVAYQLMKYYTQIYMDMVDLSVISDPRYTIQPGDTHVIEFDLLRGDVGGIVVIYDLGGLRLPFMLQSPAGETIDANFVPAGYQLRTGFTETTRFLDFRVPLGEPDRYAGRWKVIVSNAIVCRGRPVGDGKRPGFLPRDCGESKNPVEYGIAIGAGSNFRLQAYVTPGPVKVGEPILLTGVPSEAGLAITGCTVTVKARSPSGQISSFTLKDDGAHDDGDADDGEYARRFTNTTEAGSYEFTFRAVGLTRDGEPVQREAVRSKYVEGTVKEPPRDPPGHGDGKDECCERLVKLLERQTKLLAEALAAKKPKPKK